MNTVTNFPQRALKACLEAMNNGSLSPIHIKNLTKYKNVKIDVEPFKVFLHHKDAHIRKGAISVIFRYGDKMELLEFIKREKDKTNLLFAIKLIKESQEIFKDRIDELIVCLKMFDRVVREAAVETFRCYGRADLLLSLVFETDEELIKRVKRYIEEYDKCSYNAEKTDV